MNTLQLPRPFDSPALDALRTEVREFLATELRNQSYSFFGEFDPEFSEALGRRGWIGMAFPKQYGGGARSVLERHVVLEELLAARAPMYAHSIADRQSGQLLLRFGQEWQRREILPKIAAGKCYFSIGMSEPDSGSDLASVRTRATKVEGGWRINGAKIWSSSAHRTHYMILLCRTGEPGAARHAGLSQMLIDLKATKGVTCRPIINMAGEYDFNEVFFEDAFVGDEMLIGEEGDGWKQVTSELSFERSGPERFLSAQGLLEQMVGVLHAAGASAIGAGTRERCAVAVGRMVAHLCTLRRMSRSIATMLERGEEPALQAAIVKDLGTLYEQEIPEVLRLLLDAEPDTTSPSPYVVALAETMLRSPSCTIRGGTTEILRGIIARGIGAR